MQEASKFFRLPWRYLAHFTLRQHPSTSTRACSHHNVCGMQMSECYVACGIACCTLHVAMHVACCGSSVRIIFIRRTRPTQAASRTSHHMKPTWRRHRRTRHVAKRTTSSKPIRRRCMVHDAHSIQAKEIHTIGLDSMVHVEFFVGSDALGWVWGAARSR